MDNFEAIMKMNREQLEAFLDGVYCAGLNNGMYATFHEEESEEILGENPFDAAWLSEDAEPATLCVEDDDGDRYLLNACTKSILCNAEIDDNETE